MQKTMAFKTTKIDFSRQLVNIDEEAKPMTETVKGNVTPVTLKKAAYLALKGQRWVTNPDGSQQIENFSLEETFKRITFAQLILRSTEPIEFEKEDLEFVCEKIVKYMPIDVSGPALLEIELQSKA